jgi:hypothetical protein
LIGYFRRNISVVARALVIVGSLALLIPIGTFAGAIGINVVGGILAVFFIGRELAATRISRTSTALPTPLNLRARSKINSHFSLD